MEINDITFDEEENTSRRFNVLPGLGDRKDPFLGKIPYYFIQTKTIGRFIIFMRSTAKIENRLKALTAINNKPKNSGFEYYSKIESGDKEQGAFLVAKINDILLKSHKAIDFCDLPSILTIYFDKNKKDFYEKRNKDRLLLSSVSSKFLQEKIIDTVCEHENTVLVKNLDDFLKILRAQKEKWESAFYRGITYFDYECMPSIYRNDVICKNEDKLYKDYVAKFPLVFSGKTPIEKLTMMQHYTLPTRLLDTTKNPLIALYMVCNEVFCEKEKYDLIGEVMTFTPSEEYVKYYDSDKVFMMSCLPMLSGFDKNTLLGLCETCGDESYKMDKSYKEFYEVIKKNIPYFENRIVLKDLTSAFFVNVGMINERIVAQNGSFIICGLNKNYIEDNFRNKKFRIFVTNKKKILEELKQINISDETMLRDLDHVANYLKKIYG